MTPRPPHPATADVDAPLGGDELAWLAFRYVAGELSGAAAAAFELRLDRDQAAREAVAEAVAVAAALAGVARPATAEPAPVNHALVLVGGRPHRPRRRGRRIVGTLVGLAAVIALIALPWLGAVSTGSGRGEVDHRILALTWSGLWQAADADADVDATPQWPAPVDEPASHRPDALVAWLDESTALGPDDPAAHPELDADAAGPPTWMVEAASLDQSGS